MNPANAREALVEAQLDFEEGADFLMVKPALAYLDIIKSLHDNFDTVSYTHLDVYKRQAFRLCFRKFVTFNWSFNDLAFME